MAQIRLLTFDLDDTLWEVTPVLIRAERQVKKFLLDNCPKVLENYNTERFIELRRELFNSEPDLQHQISQLRIRAMHIALQRSGYSDEQAQQFAAEAFSVFIDARHLVAYFEGVLETLELLQQNYELGVLTNGNADVTRLDVNPYFSFAVAAEHINASKPAPDHFHKAMQLAGVDSSQMIHIGDHPEHDILAAQQLGIKTVWVNFSGQDWPDVEPPTAQVTRFKDLPQAIAALDL